MRKYTIWNRADNALDKGGFSSSVWTDYADKIVFKNLEICIFESYVRVVLYGHIFYADNAHITLL